MKPDITPEDFSRRFHALGITPKDAAPLLEFASEIELDAGEPLIEHGQRADTLYLLLAGRLRMSIDAGGATLLIGSVDPGRWVGEFGFIDPGVANAAVIAERPSRVMSLDRAALGAVYKNSPGAASELLQGLSRDLARRLRATSRQVLVRDDAAHFEVKSEAAAPPAPGSQANLVDRIRKLLGLGGEAR